MTERSSLTVTFEGDDGIIVEFPEESISLQVPITCVGENLYRLDAVPFLVEGAGFRDVVEAERVHGGKLRVRRVVERSGWHTFDFILPPWKIDGELCQELLRRLEGLGGHWERLFGGLLFVCIPPGLDLDPTEWARVFGTIERVG
jgi:hypothetical protein